MWYPASRDLTSKPSSESINHTLFSVRYGSSTPWDDRELHDSWQEPNGDELWFVD